MADNSSRLDASGVSETLASDDLAGVKYQRVKLNIGADGSSVDVVPPADGPTAAAILPAAGLIYSASGDTWKRVRASEFDGQAQNLVAVAGPMLFNESTFDRQRGNTQGAILASAARTTAQSSAQQTNYNARGVIVTLTITVASGTGGLTLRIVGQGVSGFAAFNINAAPTAIVATGTYAYEVYPGASTAGTTGAAVVSQRTSGSLPRFWRVDVGVGDASSYTYQIDYSLIV